MLWFAIKLELKRFTTWMRVNLLMRRREFCGRVAPPPHGPFVCTESLGHEGAHRAHTTTGELAATWNNNHS